jgi:hypothetical protein
MLWLIYFRGMEWREKRRLGTEMKDAENEKKRAGREEEGNSGRADSRDDKETEVPPIEGGEAEVQAVGGRGKREK